MTFIQPLIIYLSLFPGLHTECSENETSGGSFGPLLGHGNMRSTQKIANMREAEAKTVHLFQNESELKLQWITFLKLRLLNER